MCKYHLVLSLGIGAPRLVTGYGYCCEEQTPLTQGSCVLSLSLWQADLLPNNYSEIHSLITPATSQVPHGLVWPVATVLDSAKTGCFHHHRQVYGQPC